MATKIYLDRIRYVGTSDFCNDSPMLKTVTKNRNEKTLHNLKFNISFGINEL